QAPHTKKERSWEQQPYAASSSSESSCRRQVRTCCSNSSCPAELCSPCCSTCIGGAVHLERAQRHATSCWGGSERCASRRSLRRSRTSLQCGADGIASVTGSRQSRSPPSGDRRAP